MWGSIFTTQIQQVHSANVVIYRVCLSPRNQHCFPVAICLSSDRYDSSPLECTTHVQ